MDYQEVNRAVFDSRSRNGWKWALPLTPDEFRETVEGGRGLYLTPTRTVPRKWFPDLKGLKVLGLASAGGQQMPVLSKLGADVISVDISDEMLNSDRMVAERENTHLGILKHDITRSLPFANSSFDMVFMPVCLCYMEKIDPVFSEIQRVLKPGGILLTGQDNGMNYLFDDDGNLSGSFPYNPLEDPEIMEECLSGGSGVQFSHTEGEIVASIINSGLVIEDIYEDTDLTGPLMERGIPSFVAIKARKS